MSHPKQKVNSQEEIDREPFLYLNIDDNSVLNKIEDRTPCPKCYKSRKYFCYTCYVPVEYLNGKIPVVKLPLKIDVIKHKNEIDGKSTAAHAAILAPDDVTVYTYPDIPNYESHSDVVLIFPSSNAITVNQLYNKNIVRESQFVNKHQNGTLLKSILKTNEEHELKAISKNVYENIPIKRAVFIDSTWNQSKGIYKDNRINKLRSIVLQNRASQFWRHQKNSPRWYLATIEAIHQFLIEIHINAWGLNLNYNGLRNIFYMSPQKFEIMHESNKHKLNSNCASYNGQYDNMLFFFKYMHKKIHEYYDHMQLESYKRPMT